MRPVLNFCCMLIINVVYLTNSKYIEHQLYQDTEHFKLFNILVALHRVSFYLFM